MDFNVRNVELKIVNEAKSSGVIFIIANGGVSYL